MVSKIPALRFVKEFRGPIQPFLDSLALIVKSGMAGRSGLLVASDVDTCTWTLLSPGPSLPASLVTLGELTWASADFSPHFWLDRPLSRDGKGTRVGGKRLGSIDDFPIEQLCRTSNPFHLLIQLTDGRVPVSTDGLLLSLEVQTDSRDVADTIARWLGGYVATRQRSTFVYDSEVAFCLRPPVATPFFNPEGVLQPSPDLLSLLSSHPEELDSHCLVGGEVGSGKTNSVKLVLDRAIRSRDLRGSCIIDVKGEYRSWARKHGATYIPVGNDPSCLKDLHVNLFVPARKQRLDAHIRNLSLLFTVGEFGGAAPTIPSYMRFVIAEFYRRKWRLSNAQFQQVRSLTGQELLSQPHIFSFSPLNSSETMIDLFYRYWQRYGAEDLRTWTAGHKGPNISDVAAVLSARIYSVQSSLLRYFDCRPNSRGIDTLLSQNIVLSLQGLEASETQTLMFLFALFYISVVQLEPEPPSRALRNVFVLEEAHRVLERPRGETQEFDTAGAHLARLWDIAIREYRSKGFGIVISDQSPSSLIDAAMQANTKIAHRMPSPVDQDLLSRTLALPPDTTLSMLDKGECWVKQGPSQVRHYLLPEWSPSSE